VSTLTRPIHRSKCVKSRRLVQSETGVSGRCVVKGLLGSNLMIGGPEKSEKRASRASLSSLDVCEIKGVGRILYALKRYVMFYLVPFRH
jgi:hypothetical protein